MKDSKKVSGVGFSTLKIIDTRTDIEEVDFTDIDGLSPAASQAIVLNGAKTIVALPSHAFEDGSVDITPLLYDEAGDFVGILETKRSGVGSAHFFSNYTYQSPALTWEVNGVYKVLFHITALSAMNVLTLKMGVTE